MTAASSTPATAGRRRALLCGCATVIGAAGMGGCVAEDPDPVPQNPVPDDLLTAADLIGKTLRVYHAGDPLTRDYRQDRANIELGPDERIVTVWVG